MPTPRGNFPNAGHYYANTFRPTRIDVQFTVAHADTGGLGLTSPKSNGFVQAMFMNTNQTPGVSDGLTNPNPAAGFLQIFLKNNFAAFLGAQAIIRSPLTGSSVKIDNSAMTAGVPYVITTLGNATLAKWQAIGVPLGVTPAVGVAFIALTNGGSGNTLTSRVQTASVSAVQTLELVSNPDLNTASSIVKNGESLIFQFLAPTISTGAYIAPMLPTAPADGSVVSLGLLFDGSSQTVDGL
jgi:hypothetical protein